MLVDRFRPASGALALDGTQSPDHYWWLAYALGEPLSRAAPSARASRGRASRCAASARRVGIDGRGASGRERRSCSSRVTTTPSSTSSSRRTARSRARRSRAARRSGSSGSTAPSSSRRAPRRSRSSGPSGRRSPPARRRRPALDAVAFDHLFDRGPALRGVATPVPQHVGAGAPRGRSTRRSARHRTGRRRSRRSRATCPTSPARSGSGEGRSSTRCSGPRTRTRSRTTRTRACDYFRRTRRIERIEVRNFKVLGDLDLRPGSLASTAATAPWLMLLGENGCGKSSLLQAVALALMGAAGARRARARRAVVRPQRHAGRLRPRPPRRQPGADRARGSRAPSASSAAATSRS